MMTKCEVKDLRVNGVNYTLFCFFIHIKFKVCLGIANILSHLLLCKL